MTISITRPTLLIDKRKCLANINRMAEMARRNRVIFRPHFKTHQSAEIGEWFRQAGVEAITVSSVSMAGYFAENGWNDITLAFPVNILEMDAINRLASQIRLNLLLESSETAAFLSLNLIAAAGIFIKIDTGYHRAGLDPEDTPAISAILSVINNNNNLTFKGFLTHTGQTYQAKSPEEIRFHHESAGKQLLRLKHQYENRYPEIILSTGDTPSCSLFSPVPGIGEIRPGNFVFYDLMQFITGSCRLEDIAVAALCPVVSLHYERNEAVIYGGAVHLSKEYCMAAEKQVYGLALRFNGESWDYSSPLGYLTTLSQEHGILSLNAGILLRPGEQIAILPVHSCLMAHELKQDRLIFESRNP